MWGAQGSTQHRGPTEGHWPHKPDVAVRLGPMLLPVERRLTLALIEAQDCSDLLSTPPRKVWFPCLGREAFEDLREMLHGE